MDRADAVRTVEILVFDGANELDAVGPLEVFDTAARRGVDLEPRVVTRDPARRVSARHGLTIEPRGTLSPAPDLLVVPGGGWTDGDDRGIRAEIEQGLPDAIAERHAAGSAIAGVCTGVMAVAAAGLLDGRDAVTHRGAREDLREAGASVVDARVVDGGDVLTAGGVTSGLDLALHVVGAVSGDDTATAVAETMEYERRGPVHTPDGPR